MDRDRAANILGYYILRFMLGVSRQKRRLLLPDVQKKHKITPRLVFIFQDSNYNVGFFSDFI